MEMLALAQHGWLHSLRSELCVMRGIICSVRHDIPITGAIAPHKSDTRYMFGELSDEVINGNLSKITQEKIVGLLLQPGERSM